uniref:Uncharacterized protein n=1 Tax=viral metagenome TaxID=1070528 RepID=A0A6H1ZB07_9ZZZZ
MKKIKQYIPYTFLAAVIIVVIVVLLARTEPGPLDQFITRRTCDFVEWADFKAFACTDGFTGRYSPLVP